jgi:hypothetical protein
MPARPAASPRVMDVQALPTGQGHRTVDGRSIDSTPCAPARAAHAASAPAGEAVAQPQQHPELDIHRVADAEQLLEELDACGVSPSYDLPSYCCRV